MAAPASLRVDVYGPHGGVVAAVASDGARLVVVDVAHNGRTEVAADAAGFDALWPFAPLHLDAAGWVALLRGEFAAPADAACRAEGSGSVVQWAAGPRTLAARRDEAGTLLALTLTEGAVTVAQAEIRARGADGLPRAWRLVVPGRGQVVDVRLEDVEAGEPADPEIFRLAT